MSQHRFEISVNKFILKIHYGGTEDGGIEWCKRFMTSFQKQVANVQMEVAIFKRSISEDRWSRRDQPFEYVKTLIRKPLTKRVRKEKNNEEKKSPH